MAPMRAQSGYAPGLFGSATQILPGGARRGRLLAPITTRRERHLEQPISSDVSVARGLVDREALLQTLDRAVTRRITVISAPAGSGKTSLLRTWADRSTRVGRVAFVSVDRDEQDAQRFWSAILVALRSP